MATDAIRGMISSQNARRILALALFAAFALLCFAPGAQAEAKTMTLENAKGTVHVYPDWYDKSEDTFYGAYWINASDYTDIEPTEVKSSNKKVCIAEPSYSTLDLIISKPGTATVSYTWKGKAHKIKVVVHKWTRPASSFTLDGRQRIGEFKTKSQVPLSSKYVTGKVKVKAAKGWKLASLTAVSTNRAEKKIKNGKTTLKKSDKVMWVEARFTNKKSGQQIFLCLTGKDYMMPW